MDDEGYTTPPELNEPQKSTEWKVVNGRLLRRSPAGRHERSVSARQDAEGHGILPRLFIETQCLASHVRRKLAMHTSDPHSASHACWSLDSSPRLSSPGAKNKRANANPWQAAGKLDHCDQRLDRATTSKESPLDHIHTQPRRIFASPDVDNLAQLKPHSRAPSNRSEAVQLKQYLDEGLQRSRNFRMIERTWQIIFCEITRQVYVHCAERGELLDRVRQWYDNELRRLNLQVHLSRERERKLQEAVCAGDEMSTLDTDSSIAGSSQRLELMQVLTKKTGIRGLGKLLVESTRELPISDRHELLHELLPHTMPLPRPMAVDILTSAASAGSEAQFALMQRVQDCVDPAARDEMQVELLASTEGGLDEAADRLADQLQLALMQRGGLNGAEGAAQASNLISKIVLGMADTTRGAAIASILVDQTTEQKASTLGDALENLSETNVPCLLKEVIENLGPDDRKALLRPLLNDMPSDERISVLGDLVERMKLEELTEVLRGRVTEDRGFLSAMPPEMLTKVLKEIPVAVDGRRLASVIPPEQLLLWVSKLLSASAEDACRVWLTQLLVQLKKLSTDSALSQQLLGVLSADVFAYAYANLGLDERLRMLSCIHDIKQQGVVSPAPFSKQEVDRLINLLDLKAKADSPSSSPDQSPTGSNRHFRRRDSVVGPLARRGSVLGPLASIATGSLRMKDRLQMIPLEQTMRGVADIYTRKMKDDQLSDAKHKMRCSMVPFVRNYMLRQYGMKSMADKALRELTATIRAYGAAGEQSLVRARMFGEMNGMLKDTDGNQCQPWPDRKTDFFLFVLNRVARCTKDEIKSTSTNPGGDGSSRPSDLIKGVTFRRGSLAHRTSNNVPANLNNLWTATSSTSGMKEILCRDHVIILMSTVQSMLEVAIPNASLRAEVAAKLESHAIEENETSQLHLDDILEIMMLFWDEHERQIAPQIDQQLQKLFQDAAMDGNGRMAYNQFAKFCLRLPNSSMDEDRILDLFDDAIRVTGEILGEETDAVSAEGFSRVARLHNLVPLQKLSKLIDPVAVGRQEASGGKSLRDNDGSDSRPLVEKEGSGNVRRAERSRRTVIKTVSSKANERSIVQDKRQYVAIQKPESVYKVIWTAVQSHFLFRHLDAAMHRELVQRMVPVPVMPGYDVIKQGDKGDYFYVAESGTFDVIVNDEKVHTYVVQPEEGKYPCFGELALLYAKPRAATIRAAGPGMLWGLDRRGFRSVQMFSSGVDLTKLLKKMAILSSLPFNSLQTLMNHMKEQIFGGGEYVFRQGDEGDTMYVIMSGTAIVTRSRSGVVDADECEDDEEEEIMQLEEEMYFGERALLENARRSASVRALTTLKCMVIDRITFERLLGPLQHIIDSDRQRREFEAAAQKMQLEAAGLSGASFASFRFQAPAMRLDTGGVLVVHHTGSNESYSVRAESKSKLYELDQMERISRELELMRATGLSGHLPMLPAMLCTFASPLALFALFKTKISCELSHFIEYAGGGLSSDSTRFVAACIVVALERLHCRLGVVYRNLSPDALAIDENGYVCLMDFRQSKALSGNRTFTLCGVADYLSPEQVTCSGHGLPVDFWGLGVLLYELSVGEGPWGNDPNEMNIYKRITDHANGAIARRLQDERTRGFIPPDAFVPSVVDLIDQLLRPDPLTRLGTFSVEAASSQGFEALKSHSWFANVHWSQLLEGLTPSPLVSSAVTHMREQIESHSRRSSDAILGELVGTTEYSGDGSWFAQY